jgi:hypothetical protein
VLGLCIPVYWNLPEDGDLPPEHVGENKIIYDFWFFYVHMLLCVNDWKTMHAIHSIIYRDVIFVLQR